MSGLLNFEGSPRSRCTMPRLAKRWDDRARSKAIINYAIRRFEKSKTVEAADFWFAVARTIEGR